jgi:uncharacterized RDD family membrane protein YckC
MAEPLYRTEVNRALEQDWDQLSIETPELVGIDMPVAGVGSRFVALLVDYLIWAVAIVAFISIVMLVDPSLHRFSKIGWKWGEAVFTFIAFLFYWGYFTLFEAFWNGRTPGKRVAKIRVIQRSGRGIGLFEAATRNLLRIVDQFPLIYIVGVISILVTRQHQRLGDLAAGTLVVHERERLDSAVSASSGRTFTAGMFDAPESVIPLPGQRTNGLSLPAAGLQLLGPPDLEVLEGFFARRLDFSMETRAILAQRIASGLRAKSGMEAPGGVSTETYLEEVATQLRDLSRLR